MVQRVFVTSLLALSFVYAGVASASVQPTEITPQLAVSNTVSGVDSQLQDWLRTGKSDIDPIARFGFSIVAVDETEQRLQTIRSDLENLKLTSHSLTQEMATLDALLAVTETPPSVSDVTNPAEAIQIIQDFEREVAATRELRLKNLEESTIKLENLRIIEQRLQLEAGIVEPWLAQLSKLNGPARQALVASIARRQPLRRESEQAEKHQKQAAQIRLKILELADRIQSGSILGFVSELEQLSKEALDLASDLEQAMARMSSAAIELRTEASRIETEGRKLVADLVWHAGKTEFEGFVSKSYRSAELDLAATAMRQGRQVGTGKPSELAAIDFRNVADANQTREVLERARNLLFSLELYLHEMIVVKQMQGTAVARERLTFLDIWLPDAVRVARGDYLAQLQRELDIEFAFIRQWFEKALPGATDEQKESRQHQVVQIMLVLFAAITAWAVGISIRKWLTAKFRVRNWSVGWRTMQRKSALANVLYATAPLTLVSAVYLIRSLR